MMTDQPYTSDDDADDLVPPEPIRVARRSLVLAAVSCRATLERDRANPGTLPFHADLLQWCRSVPRLIDEFEPDEWALVAGDVGSLSPRQEVDASWRAEGLGVLAWALGQYDLPEFEHQVDPPAVGESIGFLVEGPPPILSNPVLRRPEELLDYGEEVLALHWRLRQFSLKPEHMDFRTFARDCTWAVMPVDRFPLIDDDLAIDGVPIAQAPEELWRERLSIIMERHQAVNWLLGYEPTYSLVPTDT